MTPLARLTLAVCLTTTSSLAAQGTFVNWESPHVHPLDMTPNGRKLLAVNTPDNRLEVFDLRRDPPTLAAEISVGLDPVSVRARSDSEVWVVNRISDSVSVVDLRRGSVVATLATDDEPSDVVFAGSPARAFVSCSGTNAVLVFDPLDHTLPPLKVEIRGQRPRALAVSPGGERVYVAVFESGNQTTELSGEVSARAFPPNAVSDPDGPYGGLNPPPNAGTDFSPPIRADLPPAPPVSLIVKRRATGEWMDDNAHDWTRFVSGDLAARSGRPQGWTLLDHDVAILDSASLAVTYADGLMNLNMALAVDPHSGDVTVVGTEATNETRFEPNLKGRFVRSHMARFAPADPAQKTVLDLNPHLDYSAGTLPVSERERTLSEPRGVVWTHDGSRGYVTGMSSDNVIVVDASGARAGLRPTIEVGEGPTGIVLDEGRARIYVLNKFAASISIIDQTSERETKRLPFFDPTPAAIRRGRRHLYGAHETSGTGLVSCASCHVDARTDRLAWDLGNPQGGMKPLGAAMNLGANVPGLTTGFEDWHPMKGPMLTQTLQDIIGHEPLHWRGDKDGLEEFNPAFVNLLGGDAQLTPQEMQELEGFLATIAFPPNPFRTLDNDLPNSMELPGQYRTGRFGRTGEPLPRANVGDGRNYFHPPTLLDRGLFACSACHTEATGLGTDRQLIKGQFDPLPRGPSGENHCELTPAVAVSDVTLKVPQLRNLYQRIGFDLTQIENTAGFGFAHDGSVDSLARFVSDPAFHVQSDQRIANLIAYLMCFSGESAPLGSLSDLQQPMGPSSLATHAAVGKQLSLDAAPSVVQTAWLGVTIAQTDLGAVGLVVHGLIGGRPRGLVYVGSNRFQSDREGESLSLDALLALASPASVLTFTVVPRGSEKRIGVDRDGDGRLDGDARAIASR